MANVTLQQKYDHVKKRMRTCRPAEKAALTGLFHYYYGLLLLGGQ